MAAPGEPRRSCCVCPRASRSLGPQPQAQPQRTVSRELFETCIGPLGRQYQRSKTRAAGYWFVMGQVGTFASLLFVKIGRCWGLAGGPPIPAWPDCSSTHPRSLSSRAAFPTIHCSDQGLVLVLARAYWGEEPMQTIGLVLTLFGTCLWIIGYFTTGTPSLIDWTLYAPGWVASFVPNVETELGFVLMIVGCVPMYWPKNLPPRGTNT